MKQIPNFPNYAITKDGRVWNCKHKRWLKPIKQKHGYLRVYLGRRNPKSIHRLVLETFVRECPDGRECCHLDGNPQNNSLENLRWGTHSDNAQDAIKHKTHRTVNQNGESNVQCKLTEKDVINIVHLWNTKLFRQQEIADMYNISRRNVSHIINRETWKYIWRE